VITLVSPNSTTKCADMPTLKRKEMGDGLVEDAGSLCEDPVVAEVDIWVGVGITVMVLG